MTPFRFRLQHVLGLRRTQFQIAEAQCRQAEARLRVIQAQHAALAAMKSETRNSVVRMPIVAGRILEPLTYWFHWTETEAQRLMIQTDPHPIAKYRVIGPLSNLPDFQKAWSCKADAAMVRPEGKRCEVW